MTDKVQKIREEVEMVVNRRLNLLNGDYFDLNEETNGFTNEIMDIIDSLQKEPVSEELEEACEQLAENARKHKAETSSPFFSQTDYRQGVIDGAKWQKEQMMTKAFDGEILENYDGKVIKYDDTILDEKLSDCKVFDKVKIIVIKEG